MVAVVLALAVFVAVAALFARSLAAAAGEPASWAAVDALISARFPDVLPLTTAELAAWLADPARPRPLLLDVRGAEEYAVSHLPGALHIAPGTDPRPLLAGAGAPRPIVTYCSVGYRSAAMAQAIQRAGHSAVSNLAGSIFAWANEGRPLQRGGQAVDVVHPYDTAWGLLLRPERRAELRP